ARSARGSRPRGCARRRPAWRGSACVRRPLRPRRLPGPAPTRGGALRRDRHCRRAGGDGGLAERADLPGALERPPAARARLPQLGRAHRADEVVVLDIGAADGAAQVAAAEAALDRADLQLALADVVEVLWRP